MRLRAEFTTEPFVGEGEVPEHVTHSAALLTEAGLDTDVGPFGTSVEGDDRVLVPALTNVLAAALASGATRVTLQLERLDGDPTAGRRRRERARRRDAVTPPDLDARSLEDALAPLLRRAGGEVVTPEAVRADDVAVALDGGPVVHVRLPGAGADTAIESADLSDGLARLIADVERELGGPLAQQPRAGKQLAVRLLEERGAFEMRRSAETVAEALGVTRFTVYNYLNRRSTA